MEIPVINQRGETIGQVEVADSIFDVPMNHSLVHQAVVTYQANKRQGTHDTKTRDKSLVEVANPGFKNTPGEPVRAAFVHPNGGTVAWSSDPIPGTTGKTCRRG